MDNLQNAMSITQSQLAQFEEDNVNRYTETNIKSTKLENNKLIITLINKD